MKSKDIVAVFSRFFALYILYQLLSQALPLMSFSVFSNSVNYQNSIRPAAAIFLFALGMFLFFWFKADFVADKILGNNKESSIATDVKTEEIETAGFAIVGMFILATAIPQLLGIATVMRGDFTRQYFEIGASIIVGLILLVGANTISKFVKRVRSRPDH